MNALAAALATPAAAPPRTGLLPASRGGSRTRAPGAGHPPPAPPPAPHARRIDSSAATSRVPAPVIAAALGIHKTTLSHATSRIRQLLARLRHPPPARRRPPAIRVRTLDDLREYAAGHGITITAPPATADTTAG